MGLFFAVVVFLVFHRKKRGSSRPVWVVLPSKCSLLLRFFFCFSLTFSFLALDRLASPSFFSLGFFFFFAFSRLRVSRLFFLLFHCLVSIPRFLRLVLVFVFVRSFRTYCSCGWIPDGCWVRSTSISLPSLAFPSCTSPMAAAWFA